VEVDRRDGLYSIPAQFGIATALRLSSLCHVGMLLGLIALGLSCSLGLAYWAGVAVCALLLAYEHSIVKPNDLSRVNVAFFNVNGYISLILFFSTFAAILFT
jgi:4-hydroxybenzoate polyprenyltransferase